MNSVKLQDTKSTYKNWLHFYTLTSNYQKEKLKKNSIKIASKRIIYLEIYLTKKVKDLYTQNYETLKIEIKDTNKWEVIPCSWIGRINIVKMSIIPKVVYRLMQSPSKFQWHLHRNIKKL